MLLNILTLIVLQMYLIVRSLVINFNIFFSETCVCLQDEIVNNTLILTCTVLYPKLPISFYKGNDKQLVARCFVGSSPTCDAFLNKSRITYDISKNQAIFKTWDLNLIYDNWTCTHGGKYDSSSSVFIKGKNDRGRWEYLKPTVVCRV